MTPNIKKVITTRTYQIPKLYILGTIEHGKKFVIPI